MWNCLWGNALKRSPGTIRKSRVSYPVPGFLSSATWPSLPKKHYNGLKLNQTKPQEGFQCMCRAVKLWLKAKKTHGFNSCIEVSAYPLDIPLMKKLQNYVIIDKLTS